MKWSLPLLLLGLAHAQEPIYERPNACATGGQGDPCVGDEDCAQNAYATRCIIGDPALPAERHCAIPCQAGEGVNVQAVPSDCAIGETCTEGKASPREKAFYCQPSAFRMDLNLLDQCVVHFLEGLQPVLFGDDCSLEVNLSKLLDQNGDNTFDIFDLDLCVLAFLEQPTCDPESGECGARGLVACAEDADCGDGLYCNAETFACQRDCGLVAPRQEELTALDRVCSIPLTACDRSRGKCVPVDPTVATCEVDADCVHGAYCFLGQCAPKCYRALDCPNADWLCAPDNACRAKPHPDADGAEPFEPRNYAIHFTRDELQLTEVQDVERTGVAILNIITRRRVLGDPSVNFGYRLQVDYDLKQDTRCLRPFVRCDDPEQRDEDESQEACEARQDDCFIDDTEAWIRLISPFGTLNAQSRDGIEIALEHSVAERLSAGVYTATVKAIFDNGWTDSVPVTFKKTSPSGEYDGSLTVYIGGVENALNGNRPLQFGMRLDVSDRVMRWNRLLEEQGLEADEDIEDITRGLLVRGQLHGDSAFAFARAGDRGAPAVCRARFNYDPGDAQVGRVHVSGAFNAWTEDHDADADWAMERGEDGVFRATLDLAPGDYGYRFVVDGVPIADPRGGAPVDDPDGAYSVREHRCGNAASTDNEIDFVGLYSPDLQRLRLIGIIEIPADFCVGLEGACGGDQLEVENPFGRTIRRQLEFIGPFVAGSGRFHGIYRERISGLAADFDVTLEGGFIMDQIFVDSSPLTIREPLLQDMNGRPPVAINFPRDEAVLRQVEADIARHCTGDAEDRTSGAWAADQFTTRAGFERYLAQARRAGPAEDFSALGRTAIFPGLRQFNDAIEFALTSLGEDARGQQNHLNVYDFLGSHVRPCAPDDPAPPPVCLDEDAVRCGLALHQRAYIEGWINVDAVQSDGDLDLFCPDTVALDGCAEHAAAGPDLFALQEHNRFWSDLGQILKFDGDRARSDAFLTLFRNEVNPFLQGSALAFKGDRLRDAVQRYDQLIKTIVGNAAAKVLFTWPARSFKQRGFDWLGIMHTIVSDRMSTLTDLVDLERRVFINTDDADFAFAQHLMQHEYLVQVYLMVLQAHWQREGFAYLGEAGPVFQAGQGILNRLNPARNDVGISPNRVFFENSNPGRNNWQNYRDQLVGADGAGGILGAARDSVADAVVELQASLRDIDTLEERLLEARFELVDRLDELCGDPAVDPERYCTEQLENFDFESWTDLRDCVGRGGGGDCPPELELVCSGDSDGDCSEVQEAFERGTEPPAGETDSIYGAYCVLPAEEESQYVMLGGAPRYCIGGEMGTALQDKARVDLERRLVLLSVQRLQARISGTAAYLEQVSSVADERHAVALSFAAALSAVNNSINAFTAIADHVISSIEGIDCVSVVGAINGASNGVITSFHCPQKVAYTTARTIVKVLSTVFTIAQTLIADALAISQQEVDFALDGELSDLAGGREIRGIISEVSGLVDEYHLLTQESFNIYLGIGDILYYAQQAVDRYEQRVGFFAEHLVGRESGNILRGDQLVAEASDDFHAALQVVYKMTVAFIHHYNVPSGEAQNLTNAALALVTLDDIQDFVDTLEQRERDYCGLEAIDCDAASNVEVLRYSVRQRLFPHLRDIVDPRFGAISAGEQFHNIITQPPYVRRRMRGEHLTDQIEIVLPVPLTLLEFTADGAPRWLIDPLSCNHLLDARDPSGVNRGGAGIGGTLAVNVVGQNLDDASRVVRYELIRGAVDFNRGCAAESVQEEIGLLPVLQYPIKRHIIGYAPQSVNGQRDDPPSFVTRSSPFTACVNHAERNGTLDGADCWRNFARDRSLAAPDWKLVLPLQIGAGQTDNAWIIGDGLPDEDRPLIEDIVVYFRHRTRPVQEF